MYQLEKTSGIIKKSATIFFLIDQSSSMSGTKIGAVNHAMGESIPLMCKVVEDSADSNLKVAVLLFSNAANWMTQEPMDVNDFHWKNIGANSITQMGLAFKTLNEKLNRTTGFMKHASEVWSPAFILMSDGQPTDEYKSALELLKKNGWFKSGTKSAIAIGDDADKNVLAEFTGSMEGVTTVNNTEDLIKSIEFLSITSSQVATRGSSMTEYQEDEEGYEEKANVIAVPADMLSSYKDF